MIDTIIARQYRIVKKLGAGAFGQVFKAINERTKLQYAVKVQLCISKSPQLFYEARIISLLQPQSQSKTSNYGLPRTYYIGTQGQYNVMIMDLLGLSLEDLHGICNKKFDLKTTLMIGLQMIQRIEFMHSKNFLHRDVKPDNFVLGFGRKSYKVYLIDFGLAKKYTQKQVHIPYKDNKNLTGTARYASLNTHLGIEQSRRDDLEGIANLLIYFLKGSLPWQNIKAKDKKQKYEKIMQKKLSIPLQKLCSDIPKQFQQFMKYSRCLEFQDKPDYKYLKELLKGRLQAENMTMDYHYCWGSMQKQQYDFSE